jgi:hypothetical protein
MSKYYTGIGSRQTPREVIQELWHISWRLYELGYTLRSGGAQGADTAFADPLPPDGKVIYRPKDGVPAWAYTEVSKHMPPDRPQLGSMRAYVQDVLARNMLQVLGQDGDDPSEFLVCWTPAGLDDGGTGYALRCAKAHGVVAFNLKDTGRREAFYSHIGAMR